MTATGAIAAGTRLLHVASGSATTAVIEAAGIPGLRSIWADPLYEGPVPEGLSDDELLEVRARYLAGAAGQAAVDPINDLRGWRTAIDGARCDELILWFEHDLFDQLNLIQLLTWLRPRVPSGATVSLIGLGAFADRPGFTGLGELAPGELAGLLDGRRPVTAAQFDTAALAWQGFRAPTPEPLDALRRGDTAALPHLASALERFLQEYPWVTNGVSRSEHRLLELASPGRVSLNVIFPRMHDGERAYFITDLSLAETASSLSRTTPPMLTFVQPDQPSEAVLSGSVSLTEFGRAVLACEQDRVSTCGIDRWLGGVHLKAGAADWRWDAERGRIVLATAR
jgi:hypothetical protein